MSNLELNVPITFDAAAALDISYNITQRVQDAEGQMTSFEQSAEGFNMFYSYLGENKSGLTITNNDITLSANKTYIKTPGSNAETLFQDGKIKTNYISADSITAKSLHTTGGTSTIDISSGLITCTGTSTNTKIEFGIDGNNNAVLKFIKNGNEIYNLGPNGLIALNFSTKENRFENMNADEVSSTILNCYNTLTESNNIYLPLFRGTFTESDNSDDSLFIVNHNYYNNFDNNLQICDVNTVFYEPIKQLFPAKKLLILDLTQLLQFDTYYTFLCGERKIESIIQYCDGDVNWSNTKPSYNGKTFKSNTISNNYLSNSSNYINNGYYINGDINMPIDSDFKETQLALQTYQLPELYTNGGSHLLVSYDQYTYCYAFMFNILKVCQLTIYLYTDGNHTNTYDVYCLCGYQQSAFTNKATYATYSSNQLYYTDYEGTNGYGANYITNPTKGILCSRTGVIYTADGNIGSTPTEYLNNYTAWLESNDSIIDEEPLEP